MSPGKFNWFLHTMLFLQTQYVLKKGKGKESLGEDVDDPVEEMEDEGGSSWL